MSFLLDHELTRQSLVDRDLLVELAVELLDLLIKFTLIHRCFYSRILFKLQKLLLNLSELRFQGLVLCHLFGCLLLCLLEFLLCKTSFLLGSLELALQFFDHLILA